MPYMRNRARCQIWMGRTLRANDNLMQLCVHGGTLKCVSPYSEAAAALSLFLFFAVSTISSLASQAFV
jgi:hypothetical protein